MTPKTYNIVIAHYRPDIVSGAENSIADFIDRVGDQFRITMLVPGEGRLADFYRHRGFEVWVQKVETPRRLLPGLHQIQSWLLARAFKQRGIHAVISNTFPAASRVRTASRFAGIPHAIYMRDYIPDRPLHRQILQQSQAVFAISKDVIRHLERMGNLSNVFLTYNYIDPQPIIERRKAHQSAQHRLLPFPENNPVIGLVGRITPYKQPDLFIRAVPHVIRAVPEARFVLVGSAQKRDQEYEQNLHKLVNELGLKEIVQFLGLRKDAVELTSEFTVACMASGQEPLGRVILEAHLLGVPVVVPDSGGPAEIVIPESTGLQFSSNAPDADLQLAGQIIRLLGDPALAKCLADKANQHIMETFASEKHIAIQEQYIEQLCEWKL